MAMLAEPKRKQKFGSDPRNTFWSNDDSKFGQRMLERMGWSKGKGLGANESGRTDHITTVFRERDDTTGVGCSKNHADNWLAHQDDFNSLLESLNEGEDTPTIASQEPESTSASKNVVSLEEKSKSSRSRVHYHKFMRGKDLSSRSAEDLNCIFGRRKGQTSESNTPLSQSEANSDEENSNKELPAPGFVNPVSDSVSSKSENDNNSGDGLTHGIKTITSTSSIQEYFAQKMAALKSKQGRGSESPQNRNDWSLDAADVQQQRETSLVDTSDVGVGGESSKGKKKKRRKIDSDTPQESGDAPLDAGQREQQKETEYQDSNFADNIGVDFDGDSLKPKKKKRSKSLDNTHESDSVSEDASGREQQTETSFPSVADGHEQENPKLYEELPFKSTTLLSSSVFHCDADCSPRKKKKKKTSEKRSEEEEMHQRPESVLVYQEQLSHAADARADVKSEKSKKKKKSRKRDRETNFPAEFVAVGSEGKRSEKMKKKKNKDKENDSDEYHVSSSSEVIHTTASEDHAVTEVPDLQENSDEVKDKASRKARKRKRDQMKGVGTDEYGADISAPDSTVDGFNVPSQHLAEDTDAPPKKGKKKKKKRKDTEQAELSQISVVEIAVVPCKSSLLKKDESDMATAVRKRKKSVRFSLGGDDLFIPGSEASIDPCNPTAPATHSSGGCDETEQVDSNMSTSAITSVPSEASRQDVELDNTVKTEKKKKKRKSLDSDQEKKEQPGHGQQDMASDDTVKTEKKKSKKKKKRKNLDSNQEKKKPPGESHNLSRDGPQTKNFEQSKQSFGQIRDVPQSTGGRGDGLSENSVYDRLGFIGTNLDCVNGYAT